MTRRPYRNKYWVRDQIRKRLGNEDQELQDMFEWFLKVWNTPKDHEYPKIKLYINSEEEE